MPQEMNPRLDVPPFEEAAAGHRLSSKRVVDQVAACEERLGYTFQDKSRLLLALTHASGADQRLESNERLEFLGDAILGAIVCQRLYDQYPGYLEGDLTAIKSSVVSRQTCARVTRSLELEPFLLVGKGLTNRGTVPSSLLAGLFESLVAAIYLDGGNDACRVFVLRCLDPEIELVATGKSEGNYKSLLQQMAQKDLGETPVYQLLEEKGPDHAKSFKVAAKVSDQLYAPAWGSNKKEAEQHAACNALAQFDNQPIPYPSE